MCSFYKWLNVFRGGNYRLSDSVILMLDMHVKTVELFFNDLRRSVYCSSECVAFNKRG